VGTGSYLGADVDGHEQAGEATGGGVAALRALHGLERRGLRRAFERRAQLRRRLPHVVDEAAPERSTRSADTEVTRKLGFCFQQVVKS
jgi:hypothetical protein